MMHGAGRAAAASSERDTDGTPTGAAKGNDDEAEEKHDCTRRQQTDGASSQSSGRWSAGRHCSSAACFPFSRVRRV